MGIEEEQHLVRFAQGSRYQITFTACPKCDRPLYRDVFKDNRLYCLNCNYYIEEDNVK